MGNAGVEGYLRDRRWVGGVTINGKNIKRAIVKAIDGVEA